MQGGYGDGINTVSLQWERNQHTQNQKIKGIKYSFISPLC